MPTLQLDYPFAGGIDEKTQSQLVEPGAALSVSNLRQLKNGSYQKRLGNAALTNTQISGTVVPDGKRLLGHRDELLQTDGTYLYTRSSTSDRWRKLAGLTPQLNVTEKSVMALQFGVTAYQSISLNGYYVVAACLPNTVSATPTWSGFATVLDSANGAQVSPPSIMMSGSGTASAPAFVLTTVGTKIVCLYASNTATDIFYSYIDVATPATVAAGWAIIGSPLITDTGPTVEGTRVFDACALDSSQFIVAYANSSVGSSGNTISFRKFDASFVTISTGDILASVVGNGWAGPRCVSISGSSSDVIFVAYPFGDSPVTKVIGLDPLTLLPSATAATVATFSGTDGASRIAVLRTGTGSGIVIASDAEDTASLYTRAFTVSAGAIHNTGSSPLKNWSMHLDSKPFVANGRIYCTVRSVTPTTSFYAGDNGTLRDLFLVDLTQSLTDRFGGINQGYLRVAAHISPRLAFGPTGQADSRVHPIQPPVSVILASSTKVLLPVATLRNSTSSSLDLVTFDWDGTNVSQPCTLGENLALGGSPPSFYDGVRCSEIGFFQRPTITGSSFSGTGLSPTTGYRYVAVYEQIDSRGQWHQSNISDPFPPAASSPLAPVNQAIVISATTLQCTNRVDVNNTSPPGPDTVRISLYRTKDGGTVYFRLVSVDSDGSSAGTDAAILLNNPSFNELTFPADTIGDDNLGPPLYTQPGIPGVAQVKVTPPAFTCMISHGDRLIGSHGKAVWFSASNLSGEGYWFADLFQFDVDTGGDITALASMDGALVIFKRDRIAFVDGNGPPDNGAGGDFSPPAFIATDVGCIEPRSVVVTPTGVLFQSLRGIEMLARSRSLAQYFGSRVEATLAANPVITSAVLDEAKGSVYFTCLPTEISTSGVTIVFDYVHNIWSTDSFSSGHRSSIMWGQLPGTVPIRTWMTNTTPRAVLQESTADYRDLAATYVAGSIVSPWIKMAGLQGYGRTDGLAILLEGKTACDIIVKVRLDYRSGVVQTRTFTAAEISALRAPIELWVTFKTQKCAAFQVEISDASPTGGPVVGTGQGPVWVGMRVEYSQKPGRNKPPAAAL